MSLYLGYSDESHPTKGRYRSISFLSILEEDSETLRNDLRSLFEEYRFSELKWSKVKEYSRRECTLDLIDLILEKIDDLDLRLDVLIWDVKDSRHDILGRDDIENLKRMYYRLFLNVISKRRPQGSEWKIFPDRHSAIDWEEIKNYLARRESVMNIEKNNLEDESFKVKMVQQFNLKTIEETNSFEGVFSQVADIFAGMAVDSHTKYEKCKKWMEWNDTPPLFEYYDGDEKKEDKFSNREVSKFRIIYKANKKFKEHFDISFNSKEGFWTPNPNDSPINFWLYEPQTEEDKAPRK